MDKSRALRLSARLANTGSNAVLVLLVAAVIGVLIAPHITGWRYGILRSGSMSPAMPTGAAIVVAPVGASDVRPGDVITYRSAANGGLLITHRVFELTTDQGQLAFVTKGDANENPDNTPVTADRLVGKVIFHVAAIGKLSQQLRTKAAFFLLIALPTILIIGLELKELAAGVKDLREARKGKDVGKTVAEET
jgi:signal peptidase